MAQASMRERIVAVGWFIRGYSNTKYKRGRGAIIALEQRELPVEEAERHAMVVRGAVSGYGGAVVARGVAFVDVPSILWVKPVEASHFFVAVGFGEHGCGGYVGEAAVAFDVGCVGCSPAQEKQRY